MTRKSQHGIYILGPDGHPVPCSDVREFGEWFQTADNRIVQQDRVNNLLVSTVFLGFDHGFDDGPPVLWETMVLEAGEHPLSEMQQRYRSRDDAIRGHREVLQQVLGMN